MRKYLCIFLIALFLVFFSQPAVVECSAYEADYRPWSGYWWPTGKGGLVNGSDYRGHPAPVEKYDYVTSGTYNGPATAYGKKYYYNPDAESWHGFCWNWAAASIAEPEPVKPGIYKGTLFRVGDKKALLTVAYTTASYAPATSGGHSVNSPEGFHGVLYEYIQIQGTPIVMDLGTDGEHWNFPVFKFTRESSTSGNTIHYKTRIYYASDGVGPDYVGTSVRSSVYYYYFVLDGDEIVESGWEKGSENGPPLKAYEILGPACMNPGIDYNEVRRIAAKDDDEFEGNDSQENAATISSGGYSLLGITDDWFKIDLKKGDRVEITGFADGVDICLKTYPIESELHFESEGATTVIEANEDGPCYMELVPSGGFGEVYYQLFIKQILGYQGIFPVDPSGAWATGVALLKPDSSEGRTIISQIDRDGLIQDGYTDNSPVCHLSGLEDDFGLSRPDKGYLRVDSDTPVLGLQVITYGDYLMLGGSLVSSASADVFFPHFDTTGGWQTYFGLINLGDQTEKILRRSYDLNGEPVASDTIELAPGQKVEEDASYLGIIKTDSRCMSASTESGRDSLAGYIKFRNPSNGSKGRALVPLTMMEKAPKLVAPHIASNGYWWTGIAVMNTGDNDSTVTFLAYDGEGNQIDASEYLMKAKQNFVHEASSIFPGTPAGQIASMKVLSHNGQPLAGFMLYGSTHGLQLAGLPILPAFASPVYLSHVPCSGSWWTGIGLMNVSDVPADISFSLFNEDGNLLDLKIRHLNPNQRLASTIKGLFGADISESARYLKIESDGGQSVSGIYLIGTNDGFRLMGDVIR